MLAIVAALLLSTGAMAAPKLEPIGSLADRGVPEAMRAALDLQGVRLSFAEGPFCELWLLKSIPDERNPAPGALHTELVVSTAVGVIRFLRAATDFRGQAVRPGFYALRYAPAPGDGAHLGVSEYPDFLLTVPAADDPGPETKLTFEALMALSRKATDTRHPGVLSLTRPSGKTFPAVTTNDSGHVVLQVKIRLRSGKETPIALVVQGHAEQ